MGILTTEIRINNQRFVWRCVIFRGQVTNARPGIADVASQGISTAHDRRITTIALQHFFQIDSSGCVDRRLKQRHFVVVFLVQIQQRPEQTNIRIDHFEQRFIRMS